MQKLKSRHMKGITVGQLGGLAVALVVVAIMISIGGQILTELQATQTVNSTAYLITADGLEGVGNLGDWLPLIGLVIAAAAVIGIVVRHMGQAGA